MREIKFRAWDKHTKTMSEPFEISELVFSWDVLWSSRFNGQTEISGCDMIYLQSAGIKDRNGAGVEVYEGDIIGRTSFFDKVIVWQKCGFYTYSANNPERLFPLEHLDEFDVVIGNIHQHPELINH